VLGSFHTGATIVASAEDGCLLSPSHLLLLKKWLCHFNAILPFGQNLKKVAQLDMDVSCIG